MSALIVKLQKLKWLLNAPCPSLYLISRGTLIAKRVLKTKSTFRDNKKEEKHPKE